ncbi:MAG: RHS repeat domain-containing protein, partial [Candidatus Binatia bacterium]
TYTAATRVTTDTTPAGRQTQTTVDAKGRVSRVQAANLHPLRLAYDPVSGQPTTMKYGPDPDTSATRTTTVTYVDDFAIAFDGYSPAAKGQVRTTTDAAGRATTFEYDGAGRVDAQILPGNRRVEFAYDLAGNVTAITPPGRPAHGFAYTPLNLEAAYTPPQVVPPLADVETTYAYTADRQLDLVTRPDLETIDYQYDGAGRLDALTLSAGNELHDYVYDDVGGPGDESGNLALIVTPSTTLAFAYDGRLPTGEAWSGAGLTSASVGKTYDASLRLASQQIAVGGTSQPPITFQYDHDDLLTQAGALTLTPDPATGLLRATSLTAGGGTVTDAIDYTPFGEVAHYEARHNGSELLDFAYERDGLGRITRITETLTLPPDPPAVTDTHYRYDSAGRLYRVCADASCATVQAEYHYDANGNRIAPSFDARGPISATYDDQDRLLTMTVGLTTTTTTYTYTANGELETKTDPSGTTTYAYDAFGNLRRVALPDSTVIDYVIDGRNRRIGKIVDGALIRQWLYQDQLEPVAELDGQGNVLGEFVYGTKVHVPDYIRRDGETYRVVSDHLGSVRLVVNLADGIAVQELGYDVFGAAQVDSSPGWQPFGFAGGLYDPSEPLAPLSGSGLVRFGARDYDATNARWTAKDPLGFYSGDNNLFQYVRSDPLTSIDVDGLMAGSTTIAGMCQAVSLSALLRTLTGGITFSVLLAQDGGSGPRCRLEKEIFDDSGKPIACGYICKGKRVQGKLYVGHGSVVFFPLPAGYSRCPKGFDTWFPGP